MNWMNANLSDDEIDNICDGYLQNAAKIRFLRLLGLTVARKPNGRPLVSRTHYELIRGGSAVTESKIAHSQPVWGVH